jgi:lipoate-protein ligase A
MLWRLLRHGPADGAFNMAVDETLYRSAVEGVAPPTLRLYSWSRPTLSLGRLQSVHEAGDVTACRRLGIALLRRPSGGRAVLHHKELTFSVAVPARSLGRVSVRDAYAWGVAPIRAALERAGVPLDPHSDAKGFPACKAERGLACFAVRSGHEIEASGRKLVGIAQLWSRRGFLQHGSILLSLDRPLWREATRSGSDGIDRTAVALDELIDSPPGFERLVDLLEAEFSRVFGVPPAEGGLRDPEAREAEFLARAKYRSSAWTFEGTSALLPSPAAQ